jgi:hypothetical protein
MSCCGRMRDASASSERALTMNAPTITPPRFVVQFAYVGATSLTVIGPISGRRYRFDRPSARLAIDPRDRPGLLRVPSLRQVAA